METNEDIRYAGFWIRTGAIIIDCILYTLIFFVIESFLGQNTMISKALGAIIITVFYIICLLSIWQGTPGKYLFKIYVRSFEQQSMTFMRACVRSLAISLPFLPMLIVSFIPEVNQIMLDFQETASDGLTHNELLRFVSSTLKGSFIIYIYGYSAMFFVVTAPFWYISAAFSKKKKAGLDRLAGTYVVHGRAAE